MPRKTKELNEEMETKNIKSNVKKIETESNRKKETSSTKKSTSRAKSTTKSAKANTKSNEILDEKVVDSSKKSSAKNSAKSSSRKTAVSKTTNKASDSKAKTSKNVATSKDGTAKKTSKRTSISKTTSLKSNSSSKSTALKKSSKKENLITNEYYDLPYRYNQTVVKVLAQTPNNLFIYWDISDEDRENLKKQFGENFFETTYPVLIVYNNTLNYHFEVSINDFANSWYLHVNDSKSDYRIELGRRPINYYKFNEDVKAVNKNISNNIDYIHISTSNEIESPNDRILFNKEQKMVYYRNVKTNKNSSKPITSLSFIQNIGKIYNIYDLYKQIYKEENIEDLYDLSNPSSGNPSSGQPSSSSFR